jgi:outer membrane biosynthesis protein TonB
VARCHASGSAARLGLAIGTDALVAGPGLAFTWARLDNFPAFLLSLALCSISIIYNSTPIPSSRGKKSSKMSTEAVPAENPVTEAPTTEAPTEAPTEKPTEETKEEAKPEVAKEEEAKEEAKPEVAKEEEAKEEEAKEEEAKEEEAKEEEAKEEEEEKIPSKAFEDAAESVKKLSQEPDSSEMLKVRSPSPSTRISWSKC